MQLQFNSFKRLSSGAEVPSSGCFFNDQTKVGPSHNTKTTTGAGGLLLRLRTMVAPTLSDSVTLQLRSTFAVRMSSSLFLLYHKNSQKEFKDLYKAQTAQLECRGRLELLRWRTCKTVSGKRKRISTKRLHSFLRHLQQQFCASFKTSCVTAEKFVKDHTVSISVCFE